VDAKELEALNLLHYSPVDEKGGCFLLSFFPVSRKQEDRIMIKFAKWRVRERFVRVSVCGVKVI
jgi:hypothetical protein